MPLWRSGPNTRISTAILLTLPPSKAADMAHLCVPQNQALVVCRGFVPDIQVRSTHVREDLVNVTITLNAEDEDFNSFRRESHRCQQKHHTLPQPHSPVYGLPGTSVSPCRTQHKALTSPCFREHHAVPESPVTDCFTLQDTTQGADIPPCLREHHAVPESPVTD